ncbi:MAG: hypothetical protein KatS3mg129_1019 [Leptospiraceae bacterium]|nr:MAG: hypothetical protein KatS3mg129_1019 [Leptospiraceae bacterium]
MPWKFNDVKNLVLNNHEKIISIFIRRKRNILLIGHYPTVATSYVLGKPEDYYENNAFLKPPPLNELYKPNLFQLGIEGIKRLTNGNYLESKNRDTINNYIKELYKLTEKSLLYVNCTIASGILSLFQEELKFCKKLIFDKVIEKRIHDIKNTLELGGDRSDVPEWYLKWIYFVWNEGYPPSTIASLGLISVELELPEITSRRNLDAKNYGVEIHYLRLWQSFLNPHIPNEIWNVNPFLMGDRLHPNLYGFIIWGYHVGNKIRELGWHKDKFDVGLQGVKEEPPLLSQQDLNQINDSSPLPHENSSRPSDPEPNIIDWLILCYILGCFK